MNFEHNGMSNTKIFHAGFWQDRERRTLHKGCKNAGRQDTVATEFSTVTPNICGYSVQNLDYVTILVTRLWR